MFGLFGRNKVTVTDVYGQRIKQLDDVLREIADMAESGDHSPNEIADYARRQLSYPTQEECETMAQPGQVYEVVL